MSEINLKRNILLSGSYRIFVLFFSFVTSIVSTRYLGVELKGKYSYLLTLTGFILTTLDMGLFRSFPYLVRKYPEKIGSLFTWAFVQFIGNTLVLTIIGISLVKFWSQVISFTFNPVYIVFFVCLITLAQLNMQLQSLYVGLNKIWKHAIAQLINSLAVLCIIVIGYFQFRNTDRLAFMIIATLIAAALCMFFYILNHKWGKAWHKFDIKFILKSYKTGFRVFLSSLFIALMIRFDIILIKKMIGFSGVGIYSIAAHIIDLLQIASNMVGGLLLVKLSDSIDDTEKWIIMKKLLMSFFVLLIAANLGFVIFGRYLISTLYGIQFVPVYYVYLWLIPASLGLSFGSLFNMYLNSKGFPVISIVLPAISLAVNIVLNLILIPVWGIMGAAIATSIAYVLWFLMIVLYEQHSSQKQMFKFLIPHKSDWHFLYKEGLSFISDTFVRLRKYWKKA
jgi:O-antigen/teichoic acid export membrane protein